jgi:orotate phosphoribosyltransferase
MLLPGQTSLEPLAEMAGIADMAKKDAPWTAESTLNLFRDTGAYLKGHFLLTSGLHSPEYLQCALVLQYPKHAQKLGHELAKAVYQGGGRQRIDLVVAPAMGGLIIGHEVARALRTRFLFTERDPASRRMVLRRGFSLQRGESAIVIEDVITTGGSSREVVELLRDRGVKVVAAGSIIDRSGGEADLGVIRAALATLRVISWAQELCPLCKQGFPVEKPGSRPT